MGESEAHKRWQQENTRRIAVRLNLVSDSDILAELDTKDTGSKAKYIKAAIREKIARDKTQK